MGEALVSISSTEEKKKSKGYIRDTVSMLRQQLGVLCK
jgi:hypothetical protein